MTRANAASLGTGWTNKANAPGIFSNAVDVTVISDWNSAYYSGLTWSPDQYAIVSTVVAGAANRSLMAGVRLQATADHSGYYAGCDAFNTGDNNYNIVKWNAGTWSSLIASATAAAAGDVIWLEAVGANLRLFLNGVLHLSAVDTLWTTGSPGLIVFNAVADVALLDNFEAGDFNYQLGGLRVSEAASPAPVGGYSVA